MQEDWEPKVGLVFDSFEDAWNFWVDYGGRVGFGVRKQWTHTKKDGSFSSCRFVCCKEGLRKIGKHDYKVVNTRPETRTDCQARLGLKYMGGKLLVHDFMEEHNHIVQPNVGGVSHAAQDVDLSPAQRFKEICPRLIRIATDACRSQETFMFLRKVTDELDRQILEFENKEVSISQMNGFYSKIKEIASNNDGSTQVKEFKKKEDKKCSKRVKSLVERQLAKRKKNGSSSASQSQQPIVNIEVPNTSLPTSLIDAYNQPSVESNDTLNQFGVTSFTSLLMGQCDEDLTTLTNP